MCDCGGVRRGVVGPAEDEPVLTKFKSLLVGRGYPTRPDKIIQIQATGGVIVL